VVLYIGERENKFVHLERASLAALGVTLDSAARILDVILHYRAKHWLLLIEAVTSTGIVDGKRRKELKDLFAGCKGGLVFVTPQQAHGGLRWTIVGEQRGKALSQRRRRREKNQKKTGVQKTKN
jgi:hypothetical protein